MEIDASVPVSSSSAGSSSSSRSAKRQKLHEDVEMSDTRSSSPLTEMDICDTQPLPTQILLLNLPSILIHPPNHPLHAQSLCMSLLALRRCLKLPDLSPDIECRALTSLAELGISIIDGGFTQQEEHVWAHGIEAEVEQTTSKGLMIAQKHPSLRIYRSQLTFLAAQLAAWQNNLKFTRMMLRRLLATYLPADPPHIVYTAHLKYISYLITPSSQTHASRPNILDSESSPTKLLPEVRIIMSAIQTMQNLASKSGHTRVILLTRVLRLRQLVSSGVWDQVNEALSEAEEALGMEFSSENDVLSQQPAGISPRKGLRITDMNTIHMNPPSPIKNTTQKAAEMAQSSPHVSAAGPLEPSFKMYDAYFEKSMALHTLIIGVVFHTYVGRVSDASQRLSYLHALLDAGVLRFEDTEARGSSSAAETPSEDASVAELPFTDTQPEMTPEAVQETDNAACGIVQIALSETSPPLYIQTTHPRILYTLAYLVSCVAKKDPIGRRPKRKVFAMEGLTAWERELRRELRLPSWSSVGDLEEINLKLAKIKADLLCELAGVSIMRSEFDAAEQTLSVLIAHLRNTDLFASFSARLTLHHAHLAQAKGQTERAMECYEVAEAFAAERGDDFVRISARAGRVCLNIGLYRDKEHLQLEKKQGTRMTRSRGKSREKTLNDDEMDVDQEAVVESPVEDESDSWKDIQKMAEEVAAECRGMGGTMWSVGRVIEACLTDEILKSKQHLKSALSFASSAGDNHLRALILALIASHYFLTATDDALGMLGMCENLAAGLGAAVKPPPGAKANAKLADAVGNAPLRTWVGTRSLEIYKRNRNTPAAKRQEAVNRALQNAIRKAEKSPTKAVHR